LKVGQSYQVNCSGFDYSSAWNENEWRCNETSFDRNEVDVSSSSLLISEFFFEFDGCEN